jgi:hypothetical protein
VYRGTKMFRPVLLINTLSSYPQQQQWKWKEMDVIPMDLEVASTPRTRYPFQLMTLPPAASTLCNSSGRSGCIVKANHPLDHSCCWLLSTARG